MSSQHPNNKTWQNLNAALRCDPWGSWTVWVPFMLLSGPPNLNLYFSQLGVCAPGNLFGDNLGCHCALGPSGCHVVPSGVPTRPLEVHD